MSKLSKLLSWILRHGTEDLHMRPDGYVRLDDLLALPRMAEYDEQLVREVVATHAKQLFQLVKEDVWYIRANKGPGTSAVSIALLTPVVSANQYPLCVHGTYLTTWPLIEEKGLSPMGRNHIHFATHDGLGTISGMQESCNLLIYIDLAKALEEKVPFFVSDGVLLTPGVDGYLPPRYFKKVVVKGSHVDLRTIVVPTHSKAARRRQRKAYTQSSHTQSKHPRASARISTPPRTWEARVVALFFAITTHKTILLASKHPDNYGFPKGGRKGAETNEETAIRVQLFCVYIKNVSPL